MAHDAFFPLLVGALGLIFCAGGYLTACRRYTGLIAGFDPRLVTDVAGLARWVGAVSVMNGAACLLAAFVYYLFPEYHRLIAGGLALALVAGVAAGVHGCSRFVRRGATHEESER